MSYFPQGIQHGERYFPVQQFVEHNIVSYYSLVDCMLNFLCAISIFSQCFIGAYFNYVNVFSTITIPKFDQVTIKKHFSQSPGKLLLELPFNSLFLLCFLLVEIIYISLLTFINMCMNQFHALNFMFHHGQFVTKLWLGLFTNLNVISFIFQFISGFQP